MRQAGALDYPEDTATARRVAERSRQARGPPCPRTDEFSRFVEARLGKASCMLEDDRLAQFLGGGGVLRFWCAPTAS